MDTRHTLLIAVLAVGLAGSMVLADTTEKAAEPAPVRVAHIRLSGLIQERPSELAMLFSEEKPSALGDVIGRLAQARDDETITAVAIELAEPTMGLAQIQELAAAIEDVQSGGKDVACFVEQAMPGTYMLAAAASHVTMPPSGMIVLPGVYGELWYFKGLLDKLGLEADMEQIGAYKGAAEPWMQAEPSPEVREQMTGLVNDIYEQIVEAVVAHRGLTRAKAVEAVDLGLITATQAKQLNLIDEVAFRQDFYKRLDAQYGPEAELVRRYGVEDGPAMTISSPWDMFKLFGQMLSAGPATTTPAIAVVYVEGIITTGRSEEDPFGSNAVGSATLRWALDKAGKDDSIKAVVLRIDSPGGSALASDIVYNAARRVAADKPVIVSMGNVAASGGYYIAAAGDEILAQPGTITGSIGVVGGKLILAGLLDKIGITTWQVSRGQNAGLFSSTQRFTDGQRAVLRASMTETYERFKQCVRQGRGERIRGDLEALAGGRIYTGRKAMEAGLVDRVGGLEDAIELAADRADLDEYDVRILPAPKTFADIFRMMMGAGGEEEVEAMGLSGVLARAVQPMASCLDVQARLCLGRILQRVALLADEPMLTVLPFEIRQP